MNRTLFKAAASTLIVSMTMATATTQSLAMRQNASRADATQGDRQAAQLHERAARDLREGRLGQAQAAMEQAVGLSPRDAGYRLLLADIYLRQGRFESARATFADVLELDPSNNRAGLSFSLTQIALGRPAAAVAQLEQMAGSAPAADVGLALALAGQPQRAIEILEPAARAHDATPRIRQNLALSYALAGDWRRARAVAAQDLSPADIDARMTQWAAFTRPGASATQVASLLGVSPAADPGQPTALALAQPAPAAQVAQADTVSDWGLPPAAPAVESAAPVQLASAEATPQVSNYYTPSQEAAVAPEAPAAPAASAPDAPARETPAPSQIEVQQAIAVRSLTRPTPALVRTASVALPPAPFFRRAPHSTAQVRRGNSNYVVQLGAFISEANAERAWISVQRRFGLDSHAPLTANINMAGRTLHRVAIAGFAGQADAQRLCGSIRAQGGVCFVRTQAGDASIRWAARYANPRQRNV
ncbi:tetratricopeptide repeat protein [Sphingosinicella sp.]|uniref:tetratricopeptide repeat protein n=1 Tax=Sphingosinicella sp. TaxID=1917971 RepID=UPI004037B396